MITSDKNIHVWSGNLDSNSQKTQEQLVTVNRWGQGSSSYNYVVVGIADNSLSMCQYSFQNLFFPVVACFRLKYYSSRRVAPSTTFRR